MKGKGRKQTSVGWRWKRKKKVIIISFYFGAPILQPPPASFWLLAFYSPISGWEYMTG